MFLLAQVDRLKICKVTTFISNSQISTLILLNLTAGGFLPNSTSVLEGHTEPVRCGRNLPLQGDAESTQALVSVDRAGPFQQRGVVLWVYVRIVLNQHLITPPV